MASLEHRIHLSMPMIDLILFREWQRNMYEEVRVFAPRMYTSHLTISILSIVIKNLCITPPSSKYQGQ